MELDCQAKGPCPWGWLWSKMSVVGNFYHFWGLVLPPSLSPHPHPLLLQSSDHFFSNLFAPVLGCGGWGGGRECVVSEPGIILGYWYSWRLTPSYSDFQRKFLQSNNNLRLSFTKEKIEQILHVTKFGSNIHSLLFFPSYFHPPLACSCFCLLLLARVQTRNPLVHYHLGNCDDYT